MKLRQRRQSQIPAGWRTEPIGGHPPELILDLIAPHRLLAPAEVRQCWQANCRGVRFGAVLHPVRWPAAIWRISGAPLQKMSDLQIAARDEKEVRERGSD